MSRTAVKSISSSHSKWNFASLPLSSSLTTSLLFSCCLLPTILLSSVPYPSLLFSSLTISSRHFSSPTSIPFVSSSLCLFPLFPSPPSLTLPFSSHPFPSLPKNAQHNFPDRKKGRGYDLCWPLISCSLHSLTLALRWELTNSSKTETVSSSLPLASSVLITWERGRGREGGREEGRKEGRKEGKERK